MIKKTVPVTDDAYIVYIPGFWGVTWCPNEKRLVEVWTDGSWESIPLHAYSKEFE